MAGKKLKIGIVGGTGYTGVELLRLLAQHPHCELKIITSRQEAGTPVAGMFPNLRGYVDLDFTAPSDDALKACDIVFFATPNGVAMQQARDAVRRRRQDHRHRGGFPDQGHRRVGEMVRDQARVSRARRARRCTDCPRSTASRSSSARIVANPGCYPTAVQFGFLPLVETRLRRPRAPDRRCEVRRQRRRPQGGSAYAVSPKRRITSRRMACPGIATIPRSRRD